MIFQVFFAIIFSLGAPDLRPIDILYKSLPSSASPENDYNKCAFVCNTPDNQYKYYLRRLNVTSTCSGKMVLIAREVC